jgi:hypothetical protein
MPNLKPGVVIPLADHVARFDRKEIIDNIFK